MRFLVANWKWLLPTIGMALALAWGATAQIGWEACSAAAAKKVSDQQAQVIVQKDKDRNLGDGIVEEQHQADAQTQQVVIHTVEVIRNVPVTTACSQSVPLRRARDGLQQLGFSDQARPAASGNDAAPAAPASRPRRRDGQRAGRGAHPVRRGDRRTRTKGAGASLLHPRKAGAMSVREPS